MHFDDAYLLASGLQEIHRLRGRIGAGTHQHYDAFGFGMTVILEQPVTASRQLTEALHLRLHDLRGSRIEGVDGLTTLKIDVRVLGGSPHEGVVRVEPPLPMGDDEVIVDHRPHLGVGQQGDLAYLVGSAKAIEEMNERYPGLQGCRLGDQRHVVGFLDRTG